MRLRAPKSRIRVNQKEWIWVKTYKVQTELTVLWEGPRLWEPTKLQRTEVISRNKVMFRYLHRNHDEPEGTRCIMYPAKYGLMHLFSHMLFWGTWHHSLHAKSSYTRSPPAGGAKAGVLRLHSSTHLSMDSRHIVQRAMFDKCSFTQNSHS